MTFFFGILSVFMMGFLPGALLVKGFKSFRSLPPVFLLSAIFALSLIANYFIVFFMVLTHCYLTLSVRILGCVELLGVVWLYRHVFLNTVDGVTPIRKLFFFSTGETDFVSYSKALYFLSLLVLAGIFLNWIDHFGAVFGAWDPTVSYGRWATDFAGNHLPILTWHYPQLLPANWSLSYVLVGALPNGGELEAFPASIQGLFFILIPALLFACYQEKKQEFYLFALLLFSAISLYDYADFYNSGYADFAVAFFNFMAILFALRGAEKRDIYLSGLALVFAVGAAVTKPSGIYTAIAIPVLQFLLFAAEEQADRAIASSAAKRGLSEQASCQPAPRQKAILMLYMKWLILCLVISPWYLYASLHEIQHHQALGDILFLTYGISHLDGFKLTLVYMMIFGTTPFILLFTATLFRFVLSRSLQYVLFCFGPYFFLWLFGFEYDNRNLVFLWPVICLLFSAVVLHRSALFKTCDYVISYFYKIPVFIFFSIFLCGLLILSAQQCFSQKALLQFQMSNKNQAMDLSVLMRLDAYILSPGVHGKILTDYSYFEYIPLLKPYITPIPPEDYGNNMVPTLFLSLPDLQQFMATHSIHYLLLNQNYTGLFESKAFQQALAGWIKSGKVTEEFSIHQVSFYKINVSDSALLN